MLQKFYLQFPIGGIFALLSGMRLLYVFAILSILQSRVIAAEFQKTYFDKAIEMQDWSDKIQMPLAQLIQSIQGQVQLFKFRQGQEKPAEITSTIQKLSPAPPEISKYYFKDIVMGQAVGIYMPVDQLLNLVDRPTLLLREDAQHWTVIHEYTHHLFHQARIALKLNLPEGYLTTYKDHSETLQESYLRYEAQGHHFRNQAHLDEFILCLKVTAQIRIKMLIRFELEEITVERMILDYYAKQKNANFNQDYSENSAVYIKNNLKRAQASLEGFIRLIDIALNTMKKNVSDYNELKSSKKQMQKLIRQMKEFH